MSLSQSRHSHERNLEKSLEDSPEHAPRRGASPRTETGAGRRGPEPEPAAAPEPDLASRLAREAAEREAIRRASERSDGV